MAVQIVDRFETVKIEHKNGSSVSVGGPAQIFSELFIEEAAIGQSGQGVVPGQVARFQLGVPACLNFASQIPMATKCIDDPGDTQPQTHENNIVDLPLFMIPREIHQLVRKFIGMRKRKPDQSETKQDNRIPYVASQPFAHAATSIGEEHPCSAHFPNLDWRS
jgi:hypothetical protein